MSDFHGDYEFTPGSVDPPERLKEHYDRHE